MQVVLIYCLNVFQISWWIDITLFRLIHQILNVSINMAIALNDSFIIQLPLLIG